MNYFINPASTRKISFHQSSFYWRKVIYIFAPGGKVRGDVPVGNVLDPDMLYCYYYYSAR